MVHVMELVSEIEVENLCAFVCAMKLFHLVREDQVCRPSISKHFSTQVSGISRKSENHK